MLPCLSLQDTAVCSKKGLVMRKSTKFENKPSFPNCHLAISSMHKGFFEPNPTRPACGVQNSDAIARWIAVGQIQASSGYTHTWQRSINLGNISQHTAIQLDTKSTCGV